MGVNLDLSQFNAMASRVELCGYRVGAPASAALKRTAYAIQADAMVLCPVDTGNLMNSISTDVEGDGRFGVMSAEIGPTADYGVYVELGTSRMAGQPYMAPAADRRIPEYVDALGSLAEAAI